ncbi:MAG: EAL domain-containing [Desulfovibrionaceae bacterium]|nr:MAG: EAL domain-containing [Desulfovibrionaceae bacterium]
MGNGQDRNRRRWLSGVFNQMAEMASTLGEQPFFLAIQRSLTLVLPLVMVGSVALMVRDFPSCSVQTGLNGLFGVHWRTLCDNLIRGSFGIASLAVLCSFGYSLAALNNQRFPARHVSAGMSATIVLSCFFIITAPSDAVSLQDLMSLDRGLLGALLVATVSGQMFMWMARSPVFRLPLSAAGQDPVVHDVLTAMPAGMIVMFLFGLARVGLDVSGAANLNAVAQGVLVGLFQGDGDGLTQGLAYTGLSQVFWFFGAHGPVILYPVEQFLLVPAALDNMGAAAQGLVPPFVVTKPFLDAFARIGGSGSTLCLIAAVLIRGRDGGTRKLCLFALAPALCNVNEPILFGIPLVFNPIYAVAFLAAPLVQTLCAYAATVLDLVPRTIAATPWTAPPFLSGYVTTGSMAGVAMQAFNLVLGTLVYLPFVALADRVHERGYREALGLLARTACGGDMGLRGCKCLDRPGTEGRLAKALAEDLLDALDKDSQLFLEYQPQLGGEGLRVVGVEALLRWRHPVHGLIPPPVTVALAEDAGVIDRLGLWVLKEACAQRSAWSVQAGEGIVMSVNMSPRQFQDAQLAQKVESALAANGLGPGVLELEITESVALLPDARTLATLRRLRESGVRVAIDDFGMGHASLRYLREFPVDVIKLDRSLTMDSPNGLNGHIIASIVNLSAKMGYTLVVEGVESQEQYQRFRAMGCTMFQGFYFSRPLSGEKCLEFILAQDKATAHTA